MSNNCNVNASIDTNNVHEANSHPPPSGKKYSIMVYFEGVKGKDQAKWSSRCGALIRCHIPIGYDEWRSVDDFYKENLWQELLDEFDMDIDPKLARPILEKKFPQYYRTVKSTLRKKYLKCGEIVVPKSVAINRCPNDMDKVWWEKFIDNEYSDKKKEQCKKNSDAKAKNPITHTLGRKSYRRVYEEMAKDNPEEKVTRTMIWKAPHKNKNTGEVLPSAAKTYALVEEEEEKQKLEGSGDIAMHDLDNDPIAKVFDSDKKRNYYRTVSSTCSVKQAKMIQATKAIADKNKKEDFRQWSSELQNQVANQVASQVANQLASQVSSQVNNALNSFSSSLGLTQNLFRGNVTPRTEEGSNLDGSQMNNALNSFIPSNDAISTSKEKQMVMLLSQNLKDYVPF